MYLCADFANKMEKGYLHSVVWLALIITIGLVCMYWLPDLKIGDWEMRKVDILSDLREGGDDSTKLAVTPRMSVDSCLEGMTCIEDMSGGAVGGMEAFYAALDSLKSLGRPVRVAYLSDSFTEGDILACDLRQELQDKFGGCGVGFVPMNDQVLGYRPTIRYSSSGWNDHHANERAKGYTSEYNNLTSRYFFGSGGATITVECTDKYRHTERCEQSSFYFFGNGTATVAATIDDGAEQTFEISAQNGDFGSVTVNGDIHKIHWTVKRNSGLTFLGCSLDPKQGIVVDNYSLRGTAGNHMANIRSKMHAGLDKVRRYDLILYAYGGNAVTPQRTNYDAYMKELARGVDSIKVGMPHTSIIVVGCADQAYRTQGEFRTMPGVVNIINAQKQMAYDTHVAFWDMFTAMGGDGSITNMVNNKQAERDYIHVNFEGGKFIAHLMAEALIWGFDCYRGDFSDRQNTSPAQTQKK